MNDNLEPSKKQQEIIEAALELLVEKGYNELSLRDIAKKLGVKAPAIYWHFKNKAMLVDYMAEYILHKNMGSFIPRESDQSWQDWLIYHVSLFRNAMLAYPNGAQVISGAHPFRIGTLAKFMDDALASLRSAGMDIRIAKNILITIIRYTFGFVLEEQADDRNWEVLPEYTVSNGELTNMMDAINTGCTNDEDFMSGLKIIVLGGSEAIASDKLF